MINYFSSPVNGINIAYQSYVAPDELAVAVFLTGRAEYFLKYEFFFNDLNALGISVYTMDHRGQGASERMLEDQHKGYVENFDFFVRDAEFFINDIVLPSIKSDVPLFSISHSMGGTVSFLLETQLKIFAKMVFVSPMWGINFRHISENIIYALANLFCFAGKEEDFVAGKKGYDFDTPFENNDLTHSKEKFEKQKDFLKCNPDLALGGPTNKWVTESIKAMKKIEKLALTFHTKSLLIQAGGDTVVDNIRQNRIINKMKNGSRVVIKNGWHELLNEESLYYNQALKHIESFCLSD